MIWFRQNQFLGGLLAAVVVLAAVCGYFVLREKSAFDDASSHYAEATAELNRLQHLVPFPDEPNLQKMKVQAQEYGAGLDKLKEALRTRVLPVAPLAPNEFQTHLRQTVAEITEKARTNKVKLPENFYLGFNDFTSTLPSTAAAPLLGQQLAQITLVANTLIDAHVEAIVGFRRTPLPEERAPAATASPSPGGPAAKKPATGPGAAAPKLIERSSVDATFVSTPASSRKVINQIASAPEQFFIVRTLHVHNEKDKGPPREQAPADAAPPAAAPPAGAPAAPVDPKAAAAANLNFIVGTEKVQTSASIELVRFNLP